MEYDIYCELLKKLRSMPSQNEDARRRHMSSRSNKSMHFGATRRNHMNIRKLAMLAAVAALGLLALRSRMASATQLRTDPTQAVLAAGSTISNTASDPATLVLNGLG